MRVIIYFIHSIWSYLVDLYPKNESIDYVSEDDSIEIIINCTNSTIRLKNKRTNLEYDLDVDQNQLPLPWQIFIRLNHNGDQIRLA